LTEKKCAAPDHEVFTGLYKVKVFFLIVPLQGNVDVKYRIHRAKHILLILKGGVNFMSAGKSSWITPELIVLDRSKPEEAVLHACKAQWIFTGSNARNFGCFQKRQKGETQSCLHACMANANS